MNETLIVGMIVGALVGLLNFTTGYQLAKWKYTVMQPNPPKPQVRLMTQEEYDKFIRDIL